MAEEYGFQDNFDNFNTMNSFTNGFENTGLYVPQEKGTEVGQKHIDDDGEWVWDGTSWVGQNRTLDYVFLDGPTITPNNSREFEMSPELMAVGVALSLRDGPLPVGEIIFAGIVAYQVYLYYNDIPNVVTPPYHSPPITPNVVIPPNRVDEARKKKKTSSADSQYRQEAEHTANSNPSNLPKHEKGQKRKGKDKGGEKGDARRTRYK